MENVFWVPGKARWSYLQKNAKPPEIGKIIDDVMELIEKENPSLKGVLPKDYALPTLDIRRFGDYESRSKDILCRVYEYFFLRRVCQCRRKKNVDSSTRQKDTNT
ncbi:MAG: hypothetical protein IMF19_03980 [Proteobacteria bacterium]|nr:hypothetical protein [Pseudomonadota bacterium]